VYIQPENKSNAQQIWRGDIHIRGIGTAVDESDSNTRANSVHRKLPGEGGVERRGSKVELRLRRTTLLLGAAQLAYRELADVKWSRTIPVILRDKVESYCLERMR